MELIQTRDIRELVRTSQQKAVSTGLLTLILWTVLIWGSLRPTLITIFETQAKFQQKTNEVNQLREQNVKLNNLLIQKDELEPSLKYLDFYFPYDGDYSLFVVNLNEITKRYGFRMNSVQFSEKTNRDLSKYNNFTYRNLQPLTFNLSITGQTNRLFEFISYLENTPFLPKVLAVSYGSNNGNNTPGQTNITITFVVYKFAEKAGRTEQ